MPVDSREHAASVVAGGVAGLCSTIITNPFDVIRARLAASRSATGCTHKSLWCHGKDLFREGFVRGMSTGLTANVLASMPSNAIYLSTYRTLSRFCQKNDVNKGVAPALSALGAVTTTNLTLAPLFLLRTRVQVNPSLPLFSLTKQIWQKDGFRGFYRGTATNIAGRFVEEGLFWSVFEFLKFQTDEGTLKKENHFLWNAFAVVGLSSLSKLVGTSIAYPYNVVMTHLRTVNKTTGIYEHTKIVPTVRHIYKADGVLGFYKGLAPQLMRSLISKATQIYFFELSMSLYVGALS